MKQSKYSISEYWRSKIFQNESFWSGLFEKQPITRESVIISPVILNSYSNQAENAWAVYPNIPSVLGFLQYIYLPSAFIGLVKREDTEFLYYFESDLGEVLHEYKKEYSEKISVIEVMESFYYDLISFWDKDNDKETLLNDLKKWTTGFNENWEDSQHISCSVNVFGTPKDAAEYIVSVYEEDLSIEFFEGDIGLSKQAFLELASDDLYQNDFLKRKFTDILTNRLSVAF